MGLFGCSHDYRNYGGKHYGTQQQKCRKCGTLRNKRVRQCLMSHRWRLDRRRKGRVFVCKKCGKTRDYTPDRTEAERDEEEREERDEEEYAE